MKIDPTEFALAVVAANPKKENEDIETYLDSQLALYKASFEKIKSGDPTGNKKRNTDWLNS
ncbi:hypothetical protein NIE88_10400 [Sporolactobacillus shoreicorticis]|uniref:Uncharacterized protein n=1 Tax=Sporolactobacillus shoreicorticis TaxID=1923877 RepID=A0ABW5SC37_9BACL|nr:hypothetical protein [Sporolactobacillus shoreicorticis]MCO7126185.1 hypothetical protein [Sporolactobacillus shoreicorticis]